MNIADITGGPVAVLSSLAAAPDFRNTRDISPTVAMTMARKIAEANAEAHCIGLIGPAIQDAYDMHVLLNGEHADCADRAARDDWESGVDDAIEAVFLPYERALSAHWFGTHAIDTRLHVEVKEGETPQVTQLAKAFAKEIWNVLTHVIVEDENENKIVKELTTAQILSAVGIVKSDIEALIAERPEPTAKQEEAHRMSNIADTLLTIGAYIAQNGAMAARGLLELAIDDDDGLAISGMSQLGGNMDDVEPLRLIAMEHGDQAVDYIIAMAQTPGGVLTPAPDNLTATEVRQRMDDPDMGRDPAAATDEDAELAELMGEAPAAIPHGAGAGALSGAGGPIPVAAPPAAPGPVQNAGAPAPRKKKDAQAGGAVTAGAVPKEALALIRGHLKGKDEDIAAKMGVSRQTYINYGNGKGTYVPSDEQKTALVQLVTEHRDALTQALALLGTQ
jgi:DNA-binding XRE family transcriptional regulator